MLSYTCSESTIEKPDNTNFRLHAHDEYEILMFLSGNSRYIVEDKVYSLEKDDIIIIRKHEMHRIFHHAPAVYRRIVCMVSPEFFQEKNCPEYEIAFLDAQKNLANKIDCRTVHASGLYDAMMRLKKYSDSFEHLYSPVAESVLVEILYLINKIATFSEPETNNSQINNVISYLNRNYTQKISLDMLAETFFISKYHLCRTFRQATGHTVLGYLQNKRLIHAHELIQNGYSKTEAALLSGFSDYSAFHRAYHAKKPTNEPSVKLIPKP